MPSEIASTPQANVPSRMSTSVLLAKGVARLEVTLKLTTAILALAAGVYTYLGVRELLNGSPTTVFFAAVIYSVAVSVGIYAFWVFLMQFMPHVVSRTGRTLMFGCMLLGSLMIVAMSSWLNASALAGAAAIQQHLAITVQNYTRDLDTANTNAIAAQGLLPDIQLASSRFARLADAERAGSLTGTAGSGTVVQLLTQMSGQLDSLGQEVQASGKRVSALFEQGGRGRATAMQVRVMHVAVRKRVGEHEEWDADAWGLPISQTYEQMTQIGGSVVPASSLWLLGYQTTPHEMRALIHFNRYLGHLLGVQPTWAPTTIMETVQTLAMTWAARSYDSGECGKELIESFPAAFAPREGQKGLARLRAAYNARIYAAYCALWMAPPTRKLYDMPRAFPWILILLARWPLVTATELLRRLPGLKQAHMALMDRHRQSWWEAQMEGRQAEFDASSSLRR